MQLYLKRVARKHGARVYAEMHEVLDPLEEANVAIRTYSRLVGPRVLIGNDGTICHSQSDRELIHERYGIEVDEISVIPHGPYDHYGEPMDKAKARELLGIEEEHVLLFFGLLGFFFRTLGP